MNKIKGLALFILAISQLVMELDYTIIFVAMASLVVNLVFQRSIYNGLSVHIH
ncbi:hypothetical protein [Metabacillus niabensis]|uniref:Uncharacterized protein n=1 Tax=Metabacillus niabensis TaxID=324854 RepID=A0ABT9Z8Y9_9BACI|nr:hypothetical protein [Metabacillus niabensis]MDQ0228719.1 hypothetical protein [Metabacillus niabensis]